MSDPIDDGAIEAPTIPRQRTSKKAQLQQRIARLIDDGVPSSPAGWTTVGFQPDLDLLSRVLALTDPKDTLSGSVATGVDMWAAATLRQAGLEGVRPQASEPYYASQLAAELAPFFAAIEAELTRMEDMSERLRVSGAKDLAASANGMRRRFRTQVRRIQEAVNRGGDVILGEGRKKRVDVFSAHWDRGLELLISTKTIALTAKDATGVLKNLPNRWEEFDGDLKNLRGRFPLAVIGVLLVMPSIKFEDTLPSVIDMMAKLTAEGRPWTNAYDHAAIVIVDSWAIESTDRVGIRNDDPAISSRLPHELQPSSFFNAMIERLFLRAPIVEHLEARAAKAAAAGEDPESIRRAAEFSDVVAQEADDEQPA
jgi:hypothetical protein